MFGMYFDIFVFEHIHGYSISIRLFCGVNSYTLIIFYVKIYFVFLLSFIFQKRLEDGEAGREERAANTEYGDKEEEEDDKRFGFLENYLSEKQVNDMTAHQLNRVVCNIYPEMLEEEVRLTIVDKLCNFM